ncbi:MAG: hypothetical protein RL757_169 [Bacteroidota bacterium]|jgi:nitric oxide reductase large subunit
MNSVLIIANVLVFLTFIAHTFGGDREYKIIEPMEENREYQEYWTMGRGAFHIVSADFLLATVGLTLINFTDYFKDKKTLLYILLFYFIAYGFAFLITLLISRKFPNSFIKLWQWLLMFIIAGLIYFGIN